MYQSHNSLTLFLITIKTIGDLPGGPVVKTVLSMQGA